MATSEIMPKVKVMHEAETVDADELEFKVTAEAPQTYELGDGTRIEIIHQMKKVYRLCDKKKENGEPIYILTGAAEIRTVFPGVETTKKNK